jgi:hypothetical protein
MRSRHSVIALVLGIGYALMLASPSKAASISDPNDTNGRLDVRRVVANNDTTNALIKFRVHTERGYRCRFLHKGSPNRVWVRFDIARDGDVDASGRLMCSRKGAGWFIRMSTGIRFFGEHPQPNTTAVHIGWEGIPGDQERNHGAIFVVTEDGSSPRCSATPCRDRAPNVGAMAAW